MKKKIVFSILILLIISFISFMYIFYIKKYDNNFSNINFSGKNSYKTHKSIKYMENNKDIYENLIIKSNTNKGIIEYNLNDNFINLINTNDNSSIRILQNEDKPNISFIVNKNIIDFISLYNKELMLFFDYEDEETFNEYLSDTINSSKENNYNYADSSIMIFEKEQDVRPSKRIVITVSNISDTQFKIELFKENLTYDKKL